MGRKTQWQYTCHVIKRYLSASSVYEDEYFDLTIKMDEFDTGKAVYKAQKLLERGDCSSSYKYKVTLTKVEEL